MPIEVVVILIHYDVATNYTWFCSVRWTNYTSYLKRFTHVDIGCRLNPW